MKRFLNINYTTQQKLRASLYNSINDTEHVLVSNNQLSFGWNAVLFYVKEANNQL